MKRSFYIIALALLAAAVSCEEWEPVFTGKYDNPEQYVPAGMEANTSIAELKAMYKGKPVKIATNTVIKGQVTTSDQQGNLYKSFYIQDETGGIEIKMGTNGLYNEYKLGQWIYVDCNGLTLGDYRGMVNLGYEDPTGEYETGYLELKLFIETHIFRGELGEPVKPVVLSPSEMQKSQNLGKYVTIENVTYDNNIFILAYLDGTGDRKDYTNNCFFIEDGTYGVTTWACSETKFKEYLYSGCFDDVKTNGGTSIGSLKSVDNKGNVVYNMTTDAYAVSQYFKAGGKNIQIRTSGYAKFADYEIDPAILSGKPISITGILTIYDGETQFTLIDLDGIKIQ